MKFLYPAFLFALAAIAIPIIIHLFNFHKHKRIYFTNVRFLREVKKETRARNKLKHLLVLACRILAISFLVLAFAQPYIPFQGKKAVAGQKAVSVYLDNSFSMDGLSEGSRMFDMARQEAIDIARAGMPGDVYQLITNDERRDHRRFVNKQEFDRMLDEVGLSPVVRDISTTVLRQQEALADIRAADKEIILISDFQKRVADIENIRIDTGSNINLLPIRPEKTANIYIDSCWFSTPYRLQKQPEKLMVRIRNNSEEAVDNIPMKLLINGRQKAMGSFSAMPGSFTDTALSFSVLHPGWQNCEVAITDYPVTFDDKYYFSYHIAERISALDISGKDSGKYIMAIFSGDEFIDMDHADVSTLDYSRLGAYSFIALDGVKEISSGLGNELLQFIKAGGTLALFPAIDADLVSLNAFLSLASADRFSGSDTAFTEVTSVTWEDPLFENVFDEIPDNIDLPKVHKHFVVNSSVRSVARPVLLMQNADPLLCYYKLGKGYLYLSSVPLDDAYSNFHRHAVFVPAVYNMALHSKLSGKLAYTIGRDESIEVVEDNRNASGIYHVVSADNKTDFIPGISRSAQGLKLLLHQRISEAGHYFITGDREDTLASVGFNYDRAESDLGVLSPEDMREKARQGGLGNVRIFDDPVGEGTFSYAEMQDGNKYWKLCIIFTLIFLAIETLLLKYWKT